MSPLKIEFYKETEVVKQALSLLEPHMHESIQEAVSLGQNKAELHTQRRVWMSLLVRSAPKGWFDHLYGISFLCSLWPAPGSLPITGLLKALPSVHGHL